MSLGDGICVFDSVLHGVVKLHILSLIIPFKFLSQLPTKKFNIRTAQVPTHVQKFWRIYTVIPNGSSRDNLF
jgi:hypothetical protein